MMHAYKSYTHIKGQEVADFSSCVRFFLYLVEAVCFYEKVYIKIQS